MQRLTASIVGLLALTLFACGPREQGSSSSRADTLDAERAEAADSTPMSDASAATDTNGATDDSRGGDKAPEGACSWGEAWPWCPAPDAPLPLPKIGLQSWYSKEPECPTGPLLDSTRATAQHLGDGGLLVAHSGWVGAFDPSWQTRWTWPKQHGATQAQMTKSLCPSEHRQAGFMAAATAPNGGVLALGQGCRSWQGDTQCHDGWVQRLGPLGTPIGEPVLLGEPTLELGNVQPVALGTDHVVAHNWRSFLRGSLVRTGEARWLAFFPRWLPSNLQFKQGQEATHAFGMWRVAVVKEGASGLVVEHKAEFDLASVPLGDSKSFLHGGRLIHNEPYAGIEPDRNSLTPDPLVAMSYHRFPGLRVTFSTLSPRGEAVFFVEPAGVFVAFSKTGALAWSQSTPFWQALVWADGDGGLQSFGCRGLLDRSGKTPDCRHIKVSSDGGTVATNSASVPFWQRFKFDEWQAPRYRQPPWHVSNFDITTVRTDPQARLLEAYNLSQVWAERGGHFFTFGRNNTVRFQHKTLGVGTHYHELGPAVTTISGWAEPQLAGKCVGVEIEECYFKETCRKVSECQPELGCDVPTPMDWSPPGLVVHQDSSLCTGDMTCDFSSIPWKCVKK